MMRSCPNVLRARFLRLSLNRGNKPRALHVLLSERLGCAHAMDRLFFALRLISRGFPRPAAHPGGRESRQRVGGEFRKRREFLKF